MSAWRPLWEPRYMEEVIQFNNLQKESSVWQFENEKGLPYDNFQKAIVDLQRKRKKLSSMKICNTRMVWLDDQSRTSQGLIANKNLKQWEWG